MSTEVQAAPKRSAIEVALAWGYEPPPFLLAGVQFPVPAHIVMSSLIEQQRKKERHAERTRSA